MFRILELVTGGLVDRDGACPGGGVGGLPGMQLPGGKTKLAGGGHGILLLFHCYFRSFSDCLMFLSNNR